MSDVITRFAPSPTGHLHIGGARTALFCWAWARKHNGRFVLRIEDTDQLRSSEDAVGGILEDLEWLGIHWDDGPTHGSSGADSRDVGPFFQSQRLSIYKDYLTRLIDQDLAYPAFETPEELDAKRKAAVAAKQTYRYDRAALEIPRDERIARWKAGEACVVRFKSYDEDVVVQDRALGDVTFAAGELDDFIILKRDGFPTYHFAVVIDDEQMGVTDILRGQEHLINTPKHMQLQRALGFRIPTYAHMPLIFNTDGSKMSKRDKDKAAKAACKDRGVTKSPIQSVSDDQFASWLKDKKAQLDTEDLRQLARELAIDLPEIDVEDFRASGYLPDVVCNYIARLGLNLGDDRERFDTDYLIERFELHRIGKTNARFDRAKLLAFSNDTLTTMDVVAWTEHFKTWCARAEPTLFDLLESKGLTSMYAEAMQPRSKTLHEAADRGRFLLLDDGAIVFEPKAIKKGLDKGDPSGRSLLPRFLDHVRAWDAPHDTPSAHQLVESFCAANSTEMGKIAQPLRVALTGMLVSPPIDLTLALLGKDRVVARIERCLEVAQPA